MGNEVLLKNTVNNVFYSLTRSISYKVLASKIRFSNCDENGASKRISDASNTLVGVFCGTEFDRMDLALYALFLGGKVRC